MIFLQILLGLLLGTFTGVIPGIHPNLIASLLTKIEVSGISVIIFTTALTHTFINTIPTIYLFAPDPSTALLVHPAQKYNKKGRAHEAILLTLIGSVASLILVIALTPLLGIVLSTTYQYIKVFIPLILLITTGFLIAKEKQKGMAITVFLLAGLVGYYTLKTSIQQPLLPLFTGLFGIPGLLMTIKSKETTKQKITEPELDKEDHKTISNATMFGTIFSFLPALGPSQAATIQTAITKKESARNFLITIGCLNTIHMLISLVTAHKINKARSGAVATIMSITTIDQNMMITLIIASLIIVFPATLMCIIISKAFMKLGEQVDQKKVLTTVLIFLIIINIVLGGYVGLAIMVTASFIGIVPYKTSIHRTTLMGSLMVPTLIFYLSQLF